MTKLKYILMLSLFSFYSYSQVNLTGLKQMGEGELTFWGLSVYKATLYSKGQTDLYSDNLVLKLHYKMNLKGLSIADRTVVELIKLGIGPDKAEQDRSLFQSIFPDVSPSTEIFAHFSPDSGIVFWLNNIKQLGKITDVQKSKQFLDIWLSEKSSELELRNQLIGQKE